MWITENEVRTAIVIYSLLFIVSVLASIYSKQLAFKDKILRIILIIFLPFIGIAITLIEGIVHLVKIRLSKKTAI